MLVVFGMRLDRRRRRQHLAASASAAGWAVTKTKTSVGAYLDQLHRRVREMLILDRKDGEVCGFRRLAVLEAGALGDDSENGVQGGLRSGILGLRELF